MAKVRDKAPANRLLEQGCRSLRRGSRVGPASELVADEATTLAVRADRRVLVVEDDEDLREALSTILSQNGYVPVEAENGQEALRQLRDEPLPAVIVLDVAMPIMDGWQFRSEQRNDPRLDSVPVIVFTSDGNAAGIAERMKAAGYLQKAADLEVLLSEIGRVCERAPQPVPLP